jgi:hypothetical protein
MPFSVCGKVFEDNDAVVRVTQQCHVDGDLHAEGLCVVIEAGATVYGDATVGEWLARSGYLQALVIAYANKNFENKDDLKQAKLHVLGQLNQPIPKDLQ